jgi:hypothetical protein
MGCGAAQDIGQRITGVAAAMVWEARKFLAQGQHQAIESEFLLAFLVTEWHSANIHRMTLFLNRELLLLYKSISMN